MTITDDSDSYDMAPVRGGGGGAGGMFGPGQPLDHEPSLGQVPLISPGSPSGGNGGGTLVTGDASWLIGGPPNPHHFGRLPGLQPPQSQPPPPPQQQLPPSNSMRYLQTGSQSPSGAGSMTLMMHAPTSGGELLAAEGDGYASFHQSQASTPQNHVEVY